MIEIYQNLSKRAAAGEGGSGKVLGDGDVIRIEKEKKEDVEKKKSGCC